MTHLIRMFSVNTSLVVGEIDGIRERQSAERIHLRKEMNEPCHLCNEENGEQRIPWVDTLDRWRSHPYRCDPVAFICKAGK